MKLPSRLDTPARGALLVGVVAVLVYLPALANGFAFDDAAVVAGDPGIQSLGSLWGRLAQPYWPSSFGADVGSWRPLTTAMFGLTWVASGGAPMAFHALGILLHALAAALLVPVLVHFLPLAGAVAAGLIFAVHPVHVEAVANVVGTAEPLAALFALGALLVHLRAGPRYGPARALVVTGLYVLAVLAKEGAAVLPLLLVLTDAARRDIPLSGLGSYLRRRGLLFILLTAALAALLWMRTLVLGAAASASLPPGMAVLDEIPRVFTLAVLWMHYVRLLVFPLALAADYAPGVVDVAYGWTPGGMLGVVLALSLLGVAWITWRGGPVRPDGTSRRTVALGLLWTAAALLPVAHVFFLSPTILAERTLYLPSVGVALALGWAVLRLAARSRRGAVGLVTLVVVAGGARTLQRVPVWSSTDAVMEALLEDHPESGRGWWHFGRTLDVQGRHPEARQAFTYAVSLLNSEYQVSVDVAQHLFTRGRVSSARFFLERAWREHPEWYTAPGLLAAVELQAGRPTEAAEAAGAAIRLQPSNPSMHHLLAQALSAAGRPEEAVSARRASLDAGFRARWRSWLLLAGDLSAAGDAAGALAALDSAGARADSPEARRQVEEARAGLTSNPSEMN